MPASSSQTFSKSEVGGWQAERHCVKHIPGDLRDPGIELTSPALAGGFFTTEPSAKPDLGLPDVFKDYKRVITGTVPGKAAVAALVMSVGCSSGQHL